MLSCSRLTEERDEAQKQLTHIKRVSQMVIEEVSVLQTQLQMERSCRERAEALATKLNSENRKLNYLSLTSHPCLDDILPSISDCIAAGAETDATETDHGHDTFAQYQQQVKELRETVTSLLEEKKNLACQVLEQQGHISELTAQAQQYQVELTQLKQTVEQQKNTIKRFNRVLSHSKMPQMPQALRERAVGMLTAGMSTIECSFLHHKPSPKAFREYENVPVLAWPAYSPDMSPIEHVWDVLDLRIRQRAPVPTNIQQLHTAIEEEWTNIPQATIDNLINSM
ncbi:hypothetical protein WMY93_011120 [Mugilogobius chulae]|uniref:Tc1-like transposase DDE domain-containing protein n=1 Tax=Mugilogobius chulae TaxID=88201 RepID=A0AAW0PBL1_9GOBI